MRLLDLIPLSLLLTVGAPAAGTADQTIDLGGGQSLVLSLPAGWTMAETKVPGTLASIGHTVQFTPVNGANATGLVTVFVAPDDHLANPATLRDLLASSEQSLAPNSVEGKVDVHEFKIPTGHGFSATFTDSTMVGKPSEPGNYKVAVSVMLYLPGQVIVNATVLVDEAKGAEANALFAVLRSIRVRPRADPL